MNEEENVNGRLKMREGCRVQVTRTGGKGSKVDEGRNRKQNETRPDQIRSDRNNQ